MARVSYGVAPAMFLISGFAATQADAATTIQTFNTPFPTVGTTNITIGSSSSAQFALIGGGIQTLGSSGIGAKNSGTLPTAETSFSTGAFPAFNDAANYQLKFEIGGVQNYGLARFGSLTAGGQGLQTVEFDTGLAGAVPEPEAWAMMVVGLGAVGASLRSARRRRTAALAV